MKAAREEIWDLFRKWFTERTILRCQGSFATHAFSLKARVLDLHQNEIRLMADDMQSELALRITDRVEFAYADNRVVTGREAEDYVCCVVAFFGPTGREADSVAFAELKRASESI
jgi:hypothetical protein